MPQFKGSRQYDEVMSSVWAQLQLNKEVKIKKK